MKKVILCFGLLGIILLMPSCGSKFNNSKVEGVEKESINYTKWQELDYSEQLDYIDTIKDEEITEARIYWGNNMYNTTDEKILSELINKISMLELEDITGKNIIECNHIDISEVDAGKLITGSYNLYLLNGNKIIYAFSSCGCLGIGGKCYGPKEEVYRFDNEVIQYCKETFWIMEYENDSVED